MPSKSFRDYVPKDTKLPKIRTRGKIIFALIDFFFKILVSWETDPGSLWPDSSLRTPCSFHLSRFMTWLSSLHFRPSHVMLSSVFSVHLHGPGLSLSLSLSPTHTHTHHTHVRALVTIKYTRVGSQP